MGWQVRNLNVDCVVLKTLLSLKLEFFMWRQLFLRNTDNKV